ncbi:MAG: signal peptidase I [Acidimicrobiia bacterium]|nr:signal peptidase I [Acidimicrobiia bacterium]
MIPPSEPAYRDPFADSAAYEPPPSITETKPKRKSFLAELPILIIIALAIAIVLKALLVQAFWIPSQSMVPTLLVDDRVFVNKLMAFTDLERGDVVVFISPFIEADTPAEPIGTRILETIKQTFGITSTAVPDDLIKRVIGLPGETIEIRDNHVLVDGTSIDEPYLAENVQMADMPPRTLRDDELWVMGDNRDFSSDSRRFGPIKVNNVVGRAFVRFWPTDRWGSI